jgi:hypothetical protein
MEAISALYAGNRRPDGKSIAMQTKHIAIVVV